MNKLETAFSIISEPTMILRSTLLVIAISFGIDLCPMDTVCAGERPDPQRWEEKIAQFETADAQASPQPGQTLFVGSSSIRGWAERESFPELQTINRGFGGSQIADSTYYAKRIITKHRPRTVVLYAGDNDIANGLTVDQVVSDYCRFVGAIRQTLPEVKIVFIAIKPSIKRWQLVEPMREANQLIRTITQFDPSQEFADIDTPMIGDDGKPKPELFKKDGLHLNKQGYAVWAQVIRPLLTN